MTPKDIWALNQAWEYQGPPSTKEVFSLNPPAPNLTVSKLPKFGKALEGGPSLGSEYHTTVPGLVEDMVAPDHLLEAG